MILGLQTFDNLSMSATPKRAVFVFKVGRCLVFATR